MGAVYRPLLAELPNYREATYKAMDLLCWVAFFLYMVWFPHKDYPLPWYMDGLFLTLVLPDFLCRKFPHEKKPQTTVASILSANKWLTATCWIVAFGALSLAILAGLGVQPMRDILTAVSPLPNTILQSIPTFWFALLWVVFCPVFRVATFVEKRAWLRWVWASAVSVVALALYGVLYR